MIPEDIVKQITQNADILEVVGRYVKLRRTGKNHVGLCPFHAEDTPSFTVTPEKQIFYCFGCQKGGGAIRFIMEMENLPFVDAARHLANDLGIVIPERAYSPREAALQKKRRAMEQMHEEAKVFYRQLLTDSPLAGEARDYMEKRGIKPEAAERFSLGFSPLDAKAGLARHFLSSGTDMSVAEEAGLVTRLSQQGGNFADKFRGRLIFPILDYRGRTVAFGGRALGDILPKYLNSAETSIYSKSMHLYGLSIAARRIRDDGFAVLVEGYMDVVAAHTHGVENAVASLGTSLTDNQARLLKRYTDQVVLCYDGDDAGQKAAARAAEIFRTRSFGVKVLSLKDGLDPDDFLKQFGKKGWDEALRQDTLEYLDYLLKTSLARYDEKSAGGKGEIITSLSGAIIATQSNVERDAFIRTLSERLDVPIQIIYADLRKHGYSGVSSANKKERPSAPPAAAVLTAAAPFLLLMLENQAVLDEAEKELGTDFWPETEGRALIAMARRMGGDYNWRAETLLSRLSAEDGISAETPAEDTDAAASAASETENSPENNSSGENIDANKGLRDYLLKLLSVDIPKAVSDENGRQMAGEYIRAFRISDLQSKANAALSDIENGDSTEETLIRLTDLQRRIQELKSGLKD